MEEGDKEEYEGRETMHRHRQGHFTCPIRLSKTDSHCDGTGTAAGSECWTELNIKGAQSDKTTSDIHPGSTQIGDEFCLSRTRPYGIASVREGRTKCTASTFTAHARAVHCCHRLRFSPASTTPQLLSLRTLQSAALDLSGSVLPGSVHRSLYLLPKLGEHRFALEQQRLSPFRALKPRPRPSAHQQTPNTQLQQTKSEHRPRAAAFLKGVGHADLDGIGVVLERVLQPDGDRVLVLVLQRDERLHLGFHSVGPRQRPLLAHPRLRQLLAASPLARTLLRQRLLRAQIDAQQP